jgi:Uma2 family endonuclease
MAAPALNFRVGKQEYFEMLEKSVFKIEYWDGIAVAMAGATQDHVSIEGNIFGELFQKLRASGCVPRVSNQAVKLTGDRGYVFPDVTVVCGEPEFDVERGIGCLVNPTVVVEVLSPSTASTDETDKLMAYTAMRTIREYLVVSSDRRAVKHYFRRTADEVWGARVYAHLMDEVTLESCGCSLTLAEIYAGLKLSA